MSARMTRADWDLALEVFRACLPARGAKARDDRLFLETLRHVTGHNISWRALPERFGPWNSLWRRSDRLSKAGVFGHASRASLRDGFCMLPGLDGLGGTAHLVQMFDPTVIRAHVSAAGADERIRI